MGAENYVHDFKLGFDAWSGFVAYLFCNRISKTSFFKAVFKPVFND